MKILEVRDGFIKFEADSNIHLSAFIQVNGIEKRYIAQVYQIKRAGENSIAYAKILFLYDGSLLPYDKTLPSKESKIEEFTFDILKNSINVTNPIIIGKTIGSEYDIVIDSSAFDKKMLISIDEKNDNNILIKNLVKQFHNLEKKCLIIDTLGIVNAKKYIAGIDFKLPLNTKSLSFMYKDCLNDATSDSKSLIIEIFKDLAEYSTTVPFVPFDALKNIVDDMVDQSHIFKLLVLKNKLTKFDKLGYFAKNQNEVNKIDTILDSKCAVIDLSKLDTAFQNQYLNFIYERLNKKENIQVFLELSNTVNKKNLKQILSSDTIPTTFITHSKFKYLNDIKNLFDNFVIAPSLANNEIFKIYGTLLRSMQKKSYLISGEALNYIPLVSLFTEIKNTISIDSTDKNSSDSKLDNLEFEAKTEESDDVLNEIVQPALEKNNEELTDENLLSSIDAASNAAIAEVVKDINPPKDLFNNDNIENASYPKEDSSLSFNVDAESLTNEEDSLKENLTDNYNSNQENNSSDNTIEEIQEQDNIENLDNFPVEIVTEEIREQGFNEIPYEEIPISEETDEEYIQDVNEIIQDISEVESIEDLSLNSQLEGIDTPEEIEESVSHAPHKEEEVEAVDVEEEEEILVPDGIDIEPAEIEEEKELIPIENIEEQNFIPISDEEDSGLEEIVELTPENAYEADIIIDMEDDYESLPENLDEQIVKDVDKVFTTRKDDDISDSDLDFIDELNSDDEPAILESASDEDSVLEELSAQEDTSGILDTTEDEEPSDNIVENIPEVLETRSSATPIVPVYDAEIPPEDMVISDPIQQGDNVFHAKYGNGVVEKMIKYGNKTLFSINFDNIGRRLLDPTLTEIKKA